MDGSKNLQPPCFLQDVADLEWYQDRIKINDMEGNYSFRKLRTRSCAERVEDAHAQKTGYTLVELVIVVAIFLIIAAIFNPYPAKFASHGSFTRRCKRLCGSTRTSQDLCHSGQPLL